MVRMGFCPKCPAFTIVAGSTGNLIPLGHVDVKTRESHTFTAFDYPDTEAPLPKENYLEFLRRMIAKYGGK